ncbi:MAG: Sulfotransferase domain protein [Chthonomonadaceae bacterium]|nr:Sulfotransferase domain protein [Chthonomonadaceae bacterium]
MKALFKSASAYELARFLYRQFVPEPHYPPPVWQSLLCQPLSLSEKRLYAAGRRSTVGLTLPDFLGLGGLQSGTTWLWANLRTHPRIYLPETKELHYFSWHYHRSLKYYSSRLAPSGQRLAGEITTEYLNLNLARIRFIHTIIPDVRLVVMIRNPIDRAWAHAKQSLMFRPGKRYAEVSQADFLRHLRSDASLRAGDYLTGLDNWLSVFPQEQLFVGFYDDIQARPLELLHDVCKHLGISADVPWHEDCVLEHQHKLLDLQIEPADKPEETRHDLWQWSDMNAAPSPYFPVLEELYHDSIERLYARFGAPVAPWRCHP